VKLNFLRIHADLIIFKRLLEQILPVESAIICNPWIELQNLYSSPWEVSQITLLDPEKCHNKNWLKINNPMVVINLKGDERGSC
jgi:hypothetical protein